MLLRTNIPLSYIIGKIKKDLLLVSIYAILVAILYTNFHVTRITIPISVPMILGTVISLLLGFRSNQAYDRWWEARIIWGAIVNDSRTYARQITGFVSESHEPKLSQRFRENCVKRQVAWCFALSHSLRGQDCGPAIESRLNEDDLLYLRGFDNVPGALLNLQEQDIMAAMRMGWVNEYQQVELDRTLTRLCDSMGKCERIKNTVFPATYSLYIHFALNVFMVLLPFGLIEYFGLMEIPLAIAISACFLLIEKMAIHLQDPFENKPTDTPMTTISGSIERDLNQVINDYSFKVKTGSKNGVKEEYFVL